MHIPGFRFPSNGQPQPPRVIEGTVNLTKPLLHSGDLVIRDALIQGDVRATGTISIESSRVDGNVQSDQGNVEVVAGFDKNGKLRRNSSVQGSVNAQSGEVTVAPHCEVQDIRAQSVSLQPWAEVSGGILADHVFVGSKAHVQTVETRCLILEDGAWVENHHGLIATTRSGGALKNGDPST